MKEFLQSEFKLLDEKVQLQYMEKAAHWYYSMGSLPEAMRFAGMAKDYELSLAILNKGVDSILLAGPRMYPADLLDQIPDQIIKKHMKTVLLMVYDLHFSGLKAEYRRSLSRIKRLGLDSLGQIAMNFLEGTTSFNDLDKMTASCSKVLSSIRQLHAEQEFNAPRLASAALPSP